ncbi:MAG TPA: hypothetical protein ENG87_02915 [Candidatus Pacearchaeota archaeon]|nr:putative hydrolase YdeN [archaeon BMS3Abin17]HDK42304.1 hypothetical protein [Candidatus Pacearchaeota archaeon]HDZ60665.1 hypothetical protein [Candidatus Pacearchaeota archaeon]
MTKRVFIIHGWEALPKSDWFPWIKKELEIKNYEVNIPAMPDTDEPKIEPWVSKIKEIVGEPDENTYFIGHSIGCQAILRYLQTLENKKIGGVIFVAGWFNLKEFAYKEEPDDEEEARAIAKPWIEGSIDFNKIKQTANNFTAIFSDNDPYVSLENKDIFEEKLSAKIIVEKNKKHFRKIDNITELPIVLEELLRISEE